MVKLTLAIQNLALTQLRPDVGKIRSGRDLFGSRKDQLSPLEGFGRGNRARSLACA